MRYAIHFTPPPSDALTLAASAWLGRDAFSGVETQPPSGLDICLQELAYYTALPRRFGFHAALKAPFQLRSDLNLSDLLRELMLFTGSLEPIALPAFEVGRLGQHYGLYLSQPSPEVDLLAGKIVQRFGQMSETLDDLGRSSMSTEYLSASQLANLYRWGDPFAMDEFRFQMALTSAVDKQAAPAMDRSLRKVFSPLLDEPITLANLALFVEDEKGAPFRVHSLHPLGPIKAHNRPVKRSKDKLAA